ncbi:hypothetical protein K439DRAFT_1630322 [Ramaria rubella]|nr:hypothetical protein K439DRAFT_1630322 [Ramaria rubella]
MVASYTQLVPPLIQQDELENFAHAGNKISTAISGRGNSLAVFAQRNNFGDSKNDEAYASDIYISSWDKAFSDSRRKFLSDSFVTMTKFSKTLADHRTGLFDEDLSEGDMIWFNSIADEYLISLKMDKERLDEQEPWPESAVVHIETLYAAFGLFQAMHLPANGSLSGLVGEELLEWLNTNFIAPDSDEAVELSKLNSPWEVDRFWQYLIRCILRGLSRTALIFFESLKKHPSSFMSEQAETLISLMTSHPRSNRFGTEHEFFYTWRQWKSRVVGFKKKLDSISDADGGDWLPWLLEITHILEGDKVTIKRYCESYEEGWKEAVCVWGVWVDVGLRRTTVEQVVNSILQDLPHDPTLIEENLFAAILTGQMGEVLKRANELDIWLAAHFADMMHPLGLLLEDEEEKVSLRDFFLLNYAEYLLADPSLWRIAVLYMCECGEEGKLRADEALLRIPLNLSSIKGKEKAVNQNNRMDADDEGLVDGRVKQILEICKEHGRERVRREICRIAARTFAGLKQYPLAVSYYTSAEDWPGVGQIVDLLLAKSIAVGPKEFVATVLEIAPTLQDPSSYGQSIFQRRLSFLVRYAEFYSHWMNGDIQDAAWDMVSMFRDELVPRSWWGLLLKQAGELLVQDAEVMPFEVTEVFELLRRLEEVQTRAAQGSGSEYLNALMIQLKKGGERDALRQLESVRLALARYFARCSVLAVGGKGRILTQSM